MDWLTKLSVPGAVGLIVGAAAILVIEPSTPGGTVLLLVISMAVSVAAFGIGRWVLNRKAKVSEIPRQTPRQAGPADDRPKGKDDGADSSGAIESPSPTSDGDNMAR